jgi:hypothetical protein
MMPAVYEWGFEEPSAAEPAAQGVRVDEVGEDGLAVHFDDGDLLPVAGLQRRAAADVDELDVVAADLPDHLERALAEVAAGGVKEGDPPRDRAHA